MRDDFKYWLPSLLVWDKYSWITVATAFFLLPNCKNFYPDQRDSVDCYNNGSSASAT